MIRQSLSKISSGITNSTIVTLSVLKNLAAGNICHLNALFIYIFNDPTSRTCYTDEPEVIRGHIFLQFINPMQMMAIALYSY